MGEHAAGTAHTVRDVQRSQEAGGASASSTDVTMADGTISELEEESDAPTPRFIQDEGSWKRWKWVPYPVRRFAVAAKKWARGPPDARPYRIEPVFPAVQQAPLRLLDRYLPSPRFRTWRIGLYFGWLGLWLLTFALVMRRGQGASDMGQPGDLSCGDTFWLSGNQCDLDGNACRPFNGTDFAFRCPANCESYQVLNNRAVGDQEIIYRTLVVGGPANDSDPRPTYRGDSFICPAAIHAGIVSNTVGGCGVVRTIGKAKQFVASDRNGIGSIAFNSSFPLAFTFVPGADCSATDMRWPLLAVSVVFSSVLSLFVASPAPFFFAVFSGIFWHTGMASDPPNHSSIPDLISIVAGRYLPAMLAAWVMFDKMGVRRTLTGLTAQVEKTVLWVGACWVGALENYTFNAIPIQRLTPHDLEQQPGAKAALAVIIVVIVVVAALQVYFFRQEGRLVPYLQLYLLLAAGLVILAVLPGLSLRIHHYIIGLLLLPGTSMQIRPTLLYQGLLVGLFINGIARWSWDPILQTAAQLRGDGVQDSLLPVLLAPAIVLGANISTITFTWQPSPAPRYDGISVLVNDVERFRGYFADFDADSALKDQFVWERKGGLAMDEYFRFAYMEGSNVDDYTRAGVWDSKGEWVQMPPGPSKLKVRRGLGEESRVREL